MFTKSKFIQLRVICNKTFTYFCKPQILFRMQILENQMKGGSEATIFYSTICPRSLVIMYTLQIGQVSIDKHIYSCSVECRVLI